MYEYVFVCVSWCAVYQGYDHKCAMLVVGALFFGPTLTGWARLVLSVSHGQPSAHALLQSLRGNYCKEGGHLLKEGGERTPLCCVGLR